MPDQKPPSGVFVTKDEFYKEMKEVRDRQDANVQILVHKMTRVEERIIADQKETIKVWRKECSDDVNGVEDRVRDLEKSARNQTVIGSVIAGAVGIIAAIANPGG
jgi:translation initiation factor 6 (eIF-6)